MFKNAYEVCVIIQKLWRGFSTRKSLMKLTDAMDKPIMNELLYMYIQNFEKIKEINKRLSKKKCRNENFPSHISENICKLAIAKKYRVMPCWDTQHGDLIVLNKQLEVKGFMSDGPASFGPTENWDYIYFVDAKDFMNKKFKVFEIRLSNKHPIWRSVQLNKKETYGMIADANKRGQLRGCFYKVFKPQLESYCKLIFDGYLDDL